MTRKHLILLALAAVVGALALAACGDDDDDDTGAATETTQETTEGAGGAYGGGAGAAGDGGAAETIAISETDYELNPAEVTAKAGEITFELTNEGEAPHNLEVEGNGVEEVSETINAGQETTFTVDLDAGTYEIYCAIDGHKDLGMEGELTVN